MHINPVLNIEMKRHVRTLKCCWVFFGVNLILGIVALVCYFTIVGAEGYLTLGHYRYMIQCYVIMSYILFAMLCFLLPGIAGGTIAREREKKTLDILLSTQLSPRKIVFGKLQVSLWLILLVMITALPMLSVIFVLGGVSLIDLLRLTVSLLFAGIYIGSIGIFCSVMVKTTNRAVIFSYVTVMGMTMGTIAVVKVIQFLYQVQAEQIGIYEKVDIGGWIYFLLVNPCISFFGMLSRQVGNGYELAEICNTFGDYSNDFIVNHIYGISIVLQLVISCALMHLAAKKLHNPK